MTDQYVATAARNAVSSMSRKHIATDVGSVSQSAVLGYVNIRRKHKLTLWSYHYFEGLDRLLLYSKDKLT
jgi:hypothetical protein